MVLFRKMALQSVVFGFFLTAASAGSAEGQAGPSPRPLDREQVMEVLGLFDYHTLLFDGKGIAPGVSFKVEVVLEGAKEILYLEPHSLRSPDFKVRIKGGNGRMEVVPPPPPRTYRGAVMGRPGSGAAASLIEGRLYALIHLGHEESATYCIQPLPKDYFPGAPASEHVVYLTEDAYMDRVWQDIAIPTPMSEAEEMNRRSLDEGDEGYLLAGPPTGSFYNTQIAFDADVEFFVKNGSSVDATVADMENIFNGVEYVYERDTDITWEITEILIRTEEPDPYGSTEASTLLNQFKNHWNANQGSIPRDTAHLFTGKNLDGTTIGVAWVSVICNKPSAYGLVQSRFSANYYSRITLSAHEIGHNYGCNGHCDSSADCHIMCSSLGGCDGIGLPHFSNWAVTRITSHADSRTCLDLVPAMARLDVGSNFGADITASPADVNGNTGGVTPFQCKYEVDSWVTLSAPLEIDLFWWSYRFVEWKLDDVTQGSELDLQLLTGDLDRNADADYALVGKAQVTSSPIEGLTISATPGDLDGQASFTTPGLLTYWADEASIVLEAPSERGEYVFVRWVLNGNKQPAGERTLGLNLGSGGTTNVEAVYFRTLATPEKGPGPGTGAGSEAGEPAQAVKGDPSIN